MKKSRFTDNQMVRILREADQKTVPALLLTTEVMAADIPEPKSEAPAGGGPGGGMGGMY